MNARVKLLTAIAFIALASCSTPPIRQQTADTSAADKTSTSTETLPLSAQNPPLTIVKNGKTLNLVRIMDGGICKNDYQGAKGAFLIYADPNDIERIKREQKPEIFKDFESKIQAFSTAALQIAIDATNLAEDPFALGTDEAQQKLATQLTSNFQNAALKPVDAFQKETSLTIDIKPYSPSLVFYQKGCDLNQINPES